MPLVNCLGQKEQPRDPRALQLTRAAADSGRALGCTPDDLIRRAVSAAPFSRSDMRANRRHQDLCFYVEAGTIYGVWRVQAAPREPEFEQRGNRVRAVCPVCEGEGCVECGHKGRIERSRAEYDQLVLETQLV